MNNKIFIFIFGLALLLTTSSVFAQRNYEPLSGPVTTRYDKMKSIKTDISKLLIQNKELENRYAELRERIHFLQQRAAMLRKNMPEPEYQEDLPPAPKSEPIQSQFVFEKDHTKNEYVMEIEEELDEEYNLELMRNDELLINQRQMQYEDELALLQLQLTDYEYQRDELELQLKMKTLEVKKMNLDDYKVKEKEFVATIEKNLEQSKELARQIAVREKELEKFPDQIYALRTENEELEEKSQKLSKEIEFKDREMALLASKKLYKEKSAQNLLEEIEYQTENLQSRVTALEDQHDMLTDKVNLSLKRQERKEKLLQDIIYLDTENRKLQDKINELTDKIQYFRF